MPFKTQEIKTRTLATAEAIPEEKLGRLQEFLPGTRTPSCLLGHLTDANGPFEDAWGKNVYRPHGYDLGRLLGWTISELDNVTHANDNGLDTTSTRGNREAGLTALRAIPVA